MLGRSRLASHFVSGEADGITDTLNFWLASPQSVSKSEFDRVHTGEAPN